MNIALFFTFLVLVGASLVNAQWFLHRTTTENIDRNFTLLPAHLTTGREQRLFMMQRERPGTTSHPALTVGFWYPQAQQRWSLFNQQNTAPMSIGLEFAIYRAEEGDRVFIQRYVAAENALISEIDHPELNGNPNTYPFLTQNWDASGVYDTRNVSVVYYNSDNARWIITPADVEPGGGDFPQFPDGVSWNVLVRSPDERTFRVEVLTESEFLTLDHPLLNGNPSALLLVTQESKIGYGEGRVRIKTVYDSELSRWLIQTGSTFSLPRGNRYLVALIEQSDVPVPALNIESVPPRNLLSMPTEFGQSYQLETSLDMKTWLAEGLPFAGNGKVRQYPTTVVLPQNHYRLTRSPE